MREVTATEAARGFSALLDAVERDGETFVVTRAGRPVARIEAALGTTGKAVRALLRHYEPDGAWAEDLVAVRDLVAGEERSWRG